MSAFTVDKQIANVRSCLLLTAYGGIYGYVRVPVGEGACLRRCLWEHLALKGVCSHVTGFESCYDALEEFYVNNKSKYDFIYFYFNLEKLDPRVTRICEKCRLTVEGL